MEGAHEALGARCTCGGDGLLLLQDCHPADQVAQRPLCPCGIHLLPRNGGRISPQDRCPGEVQLVCLRTLVPSFIWLFPCDNFNVHSLFPCEDVNVHCLLPLSMCTV